MIDKAVMGKYGYKYFGDLLKIKKSMALWNFQNNTPHTVFSYLKLYEDNGYQGGMQAISFLVKLPSFKNVVARWNF